MHSRLLKIVPDSWELVYSPDITPSDFYLFGYVEDVWSVGHSWMQRSFSKQFEKFLTASKSDFASGVSPVHGPAEKKPPDQGRAHRIY
jgi:hypothetical protein